MYIDAHHHFWQYDPVEYDWIGPEMSAIRRDYLPGHLRAELAAAGIDGVVSVQARQIVAETETLVRYARENDFIRAVVGWVPLAQPEAAETLERFGPEPKFRGVRHVLQGEPDGFMGREDFNAGVRLLHPLGLVYDILVVERQLPEAIEFVDRHPGQIFVLDHVAKPRIKEGAFEPWNTHMRELARRENVFCKISGMVTEADWTRWDEAGLQPYVDTVLEAFGAPRTMFGSDWPVCLVASPYGRWVEAARRLTARLSGDEQAAVFGDNALRAYGC